MSNRKSADQQHRGVFRVGDPTVVAVLERALTQEGREERLTHGFHTYPAGLHPDAAQALVAGFPGQRVLDPFCGGGTLLVEVRAAGRTAIGRDVSPVALRVARTRCATPDDATLTKFRSTARKMVEVARAARELPPEPILPAVEQWYAPHALHELWSLRQGIQAAEPAVRDLLWCAFSSLLIKVSWRTSDTSTKREKHDRPPGTTAILFHKKVRELGRRLEALRAVVPPGTPDADVKFADARSVTLDAPVDLVLTSPPYPSTYDYLPLQHLRNVWLPDVPPFAEVEIGPRRAWRQGSRDAKRIWTEDTHIWTKQVAKSLRQGGHLVVVIGDGLTPSGAVDTAKATEEAAVQAGLKLVARASVERPDFARETVRWEHAFAFVR